MKKKISLTTKIVLITYRLTDITWICNTVNELIIWHVLNTLVFCNLKCIEVENGQKDILYLKKKNVNVCPWFFDLVSAFFFDNWINTIRSYWTLVALVSWHHYITIHSPTRTPTTINIIQYVNYLTMAITNIVLNVFKMHAEIEFKFYKSATKVKSVCYAVWNYFIPSHNQIVFTVVLFSRCSF